MSATIIDLTAERLARRGTRATSGPRHAAVPGGCRVLVLDRRRLRSDSPVPRCSP